MKEGKVKVSELVKILTGYGCFMTGHGAKHNKWKSNINGKTFYVPRHPSKELKKGTLNSILKQAGISEKEGGDNE